MVEPPETPVDRAFSVGSRILALVFCLVLGAVGGLVVVLLGGFFGDAFVPVMAACTLGAAALGALWPTPFLFLVEVILGIFGITI